MTRRKRGHIATAKATLGLSFVRLERAVARRLTKHIGSRDRLSADGALAAGVLTMGEGSYGHLEVLHFHGEPSRVHIGRYSSIADGVLFIPGGNHNLQWVTMAPLPGSLDRGHPSTKGDIVVGSDVWIGARAIVLSGVTIGDGAVVGAGAVVARDVSPFTVVTGNPATEVKARLDPDIVAALLRIRWWNWPVDEVLRAAPELLSSDVRGFVERYDR